MAQTPQTYKNHTRFFAPFHFVVMPVLLLNFLNGIRHLYLGPSLSNAWALIVAAALVLLGFCARTMALSVQDRLIRLEMHLRMKELLSPDVLKRFDELTPRQLVALRFASDGELPDLVRDVLAGNLKTQKAIKLRVQKWQGDYLRA